MRPGRPPRSPDLIAPARMRETALFDNTGRQAYSVRFLCTEIFSK